MTTALLIIDMQLGSFTPYTARHDTLGTVDRINRIADRVRRDGGMVVSVQHDGPAGDPHHPDAPGWHLLPELRVIATDPVVRKTNCDAFLDTGLADLLDRHGVTELVITGCASDFCVDATVRTALAKRYAVTVPSDGHTTADRPHLTAARIIAHHNAVWAEFLAPAGPARVRPTSALE